MTVEQRTDGTDSDEPVIDETPATSGADEPKRRKGRLGRGLRALGNKLRNNLIPMLLSTLLIAAAALAAWLYFFQYRSDQQTDQAAGDAAVQAATDGTTALLSYAPESLKEDFSNAKSYLTGDFLSYYNQFTNEVVVPAATEKKVKTTAAVVQAGVSELNPDSASVLVFINQSTTSAERSEPAITASSVNVTLDKVDGRWLISSFDPV